MAQKMMFPDNLNGYTLIRTDGQKIRFEAEIERIKLLKAALVANANRMNPFYTITNTEASVLVMETGLIMNEGVVTDPKHLGNFLIKVRIAAFYRKDDPGSDKYNLKGIARIVS